jgi:hypothetical protein
MGHLPIHRMMTAHVHFAQIDTSREHFLDPKVRRGKSNSNFRLYVASGCGNACIKRHRIVGNECH